MKIFLLVLFTISMFADVFARQKNNLKIVEIAQPLTTFIVLLIAALSLTLESRHFIYTIFIVAALGVSTVADSMLVSRKSKNALMKGMSLFFVALFFYCINILYFNGFQKEIIWANLVILLSYIILMIIFVKGKNGMGGAPTKKIKYAVFIYSLFFCFIISRGINTFNGSFLNEFQSQLLSFGLILFFLGDCQLGALHFVSKKFPMFQAPFFYFIGQLLIALTTWHF